MLKKLLKANIAILGFGLEGKSSLHFLQKNGIQDKKITILDKNSVQLDNFQGKIITGENYLSDLDKYDFIIKSPGVSPYTNGLLKFKDKLITQAMIFFESYKGKIISITQTKGKSTTATLTYQVLKDAGYNVKLVGNIGNPVLDEIDFNDNYDFVVFELSSYMLEGFENHHSYLSIIGNIYEDHLDWHDGFENYSNAKLNVLKNAENILVGGCLYPKIKNHLLNRNFSIFGQKMAYYSHNKNEFYINGKKIGKSISPKIPGDHNLDNIAGILGVCDIIGVDLNVFKNTINNFDGLNHRLKNIGTFDEITFIDDAISTTPESTIMGIKAFDKKVNTIFLGGTDRGYHFQGLVSELKKQKIKNIVLFPPSGNKIKALLDNSFNFIQTSSMKQAVDFAFKYTKKGKICLLSTASPSYSIWKNFEEKGDLFKQEIQNYMTTINTDFCTKTRQIKILETRLLDSKMVTKDVLSKAKSYYLDTVAYHNYLHALGVSNYVLDLHILGTFSYLELKSMVFAALFHDAGHTGNPGILDEFLSLGIASDVLSEIQKKDPTFEIDKSICRNAIIGTVFKNRAKNINKYAKILADCDVGCIGDSLGAFLYYGSLYGLELKVTPEVYYTDVEKGYFKFLISVNKMILISDEVRKILPNSLKNIKKFYDLDIQTKVEIFQTLKNEDITLKEFNKRFSLS